jgi:hypothetical protein
MGIEEITKTGSDKVAGATHWVSFFANRIQIFSGKKPPKGITIVIQAKSSTMR